MPLLMIEPESAPFPEERDLVVPGGEVAAFRVSKGQMLAITDLDGGQPAGLFGVAANDLEQVLSPHHTRVFSNSFVLTLGMRLVSNRRRPMMVLGRSEPHLKHDLLMPLTEASRHGEEGGGDAVRAKVAGAFAAAGCKPRKLADPINLFLDVGVGLDGALMPNGVSSKAADAIAFRVVMDAVLVVAAPASDPQLWTRTEPGPIGVRVRNEVAGLASNTRGNK